MIITVSGSHYVMCAGGLLTWHPVTAQALVGIVIMMSYLTALVGAQLLPEPDSRERQIFLALEWFSKSPAEPVFASARASMASACCARSRGARTTAGTDVQTPAYTGSLPCFSSPSLS